jgi:glycosyltransferase involved in cell wall biosynthesis
MVGLVSGPKNQLDALKAVSVLVNEWQMTNLHFTVIGFLEPDYYQTLLSFVHDKGLDDYVTFLGERTDVGDLLTGMDVGLILSKFEAFGRVTVEYMMHGLPVIASDTGANPEIVEDGITGLLCKLGNVQELASHMRTLMTDRETLLRFSANGRERAFRCFSVDQNVQQIYETYESVLASE